MQHLLFAEMEETIPLPQEPKAETGHTANSTEPSQKLLTGKEGVTQLLDSMEGMGSYELAREFGRLGLRHENEMFSDLTHLINGRRKGFEILLNLVRLGSIPTDAARKEAAETAYEQLKGGGMTTLQLAESVESLGIGLQGRKYAKMNGLIAAFQNTIGEFHSFMQSTRGYWREVLPSLVSGEAATYAQARTLHSQKSVGSLRDALKAELA